METAERKRIGWLAAACLLLAACAAPVGEPQAAAQTPPAPVVAPPPPAEPLPALTPAPTSQAAAAGDNWLNCTPTATQGGAILCRSTVLGAIVFLDGKKAGEVGKDGLAVIGLSRTQKSPAVVRLSSDFSGATHDPQIPNSVSVTVAPRTDTVSNLVMECNKIAPQTAEEKRKAEVAWVKKDKALKIFSEPLAPLELVQPVQGVLSSSFGATRTYTPKTKDCEPTVNVHNGTDIAVPVGMPIRAPMAGTVILADPDLYYEGGCVFLDLGRGLVSVTMHMSRIDVKAGDVVKQGDLLGLSGATGRVTGPHLHWAIKYRNVLSDDRGTDLWLDPVLMMNLPEQVTFSDPIATH